MSQFKEFQGKTLDDAINEACSYYGVEREKLEIEIVNDAKSGIFGLVGAKKATVQARRVASVSSLIEEVVAESVTTEPPRSAEKETPRPKKGGNKKEQPRPAAEKKTEEAPAKAKESRKPKKEAEAAEGKGRSSGGRNAKRDNAAPRHDNVQAAEENGFETGDSFDENRENAFLNLDELKLEEIQSVVADVMCKLVAPIIENPACEVVVHEGRIRVTLECGDDSGILVGREGQTLASYQYLAARMIAKRLGGAVRLQIDVGNYRERQDDRLKELAVFLGDKAKKTRRPQSTRPLSAYQRRIVHLALEEDEELQTHSKGEGAHRRVIIQLRRQGGTKRRQQNAQQESGGEQAEAPLAASEAMA